MVKALNLGNNKIIISQEEFNIIQEFVYLRKRLLFH